jgi:dolichol-phosphate mannosyltransferase
MRCINRKALRHLEPYFTVDGSFFGPEILVLSIMMRMRIVQLPVNYTKRIGASSVTGSKITAFWLGLRMIRLIASYRLKGWFLSDKYNKY